VAMSTLYHRHDLCWPSCLKIADNSLALDAVEEPNTVFPTHASPAFRDGPVPALPLRLYSPLKGGGYL